MIALQPKHSSLWVVWASPAALGKLSRALLTGAIHVPALPFDHSSTLISTKAYVPFIAM